MGDPDVGDPDMVMGMTSHGSEVLAVWWKARKPRRREAAPFPTRVVGEALSLPTFGVRLSCAHMHGSSQNVGN